MADMQDLNRFIAEAIEDPVGIAWNDFDENRWLVRPPAAEGKDGDGVNRLAATFFAPPGERDVR